MDPFGLLAAAVCAFFLLNVAALHMGSDDRTRRGSRRSR